MSFHNTRGGHRPTPALLGRQDFSPDGIWDIHSVAPQRGAVMVNITAREMFVPLGEEERERLMRAHEMMHVKVSPQDWSPYFDRGLASEEAIMCAEEARVNFLVGKAGFDASALADGSELETGEQLASFKDWRGCVMFMAATVNTGSFNPFITGVRRINKEWADDLRKAAKRVQKMLQTGYKSNDLTSTKAIGPGMVYGMIYTEEIAQWLDDLAAVHDKPPVENNQPPAADPADKEDDKKEERQRQIEKKRDRIEDRSAKKRADEKERQIGKQAPRSWTELVEKVYPLPRHAPGGLGVKKIPANRGRHPRRIGRYATDPHRRIFDQRIKSGKGGIFVIDTSGSMRLTVDHVKALVEAAPGATVVAYSIKQNATKEELATLPNFFILAHKGRMVHEVPQEVVKSTIHRTNGNDLPALRWAVSKAKAKEPIIWVSDGGVHFGSSSTYDEARTSLKRWLTRNPGRIIQAHTVSDAIKWCLSQAA